MKRLTIWLVAAAAFACVSVAEAKGGYHYHAPSYKAPRSSYSSPTTHVRGYLKSNGTYVMPYQRTSPNSSRLDNWSTKGNVNPYTGKAGTKDPYASDNDGGGY